MKEHDRLEEEAKVLVETLQLLLTALGLVVLGSLGSPVLIPMLISLVLLFPCAFAVNKLQHLLNR